MAKTRSDPWLLLLHHLPPKPGYLRAKVLRRLQQVGAVAIKKSAYLLPHTDACREDLQWVLRDIREGGGEGWLFATSVVAGFTDDEIREAFRAARAADYAELADAARKLLETLRQRSDTSSPAPDARPSLLNDLARLRGRDAAVRRIDFFGASNAREVETLVNEIEHALEDRHPETAAANRPAAEFRARTWVTRRGVEEDRIASAWLIRRFVDPAARFRFVEADAYAPAPHEVAFDMFDDGPFTHRRGLVSFEVLLAHFSLHEPALRAIGEIVHDIDLKDEKHARPEAPGVALAIEGIVLGNPDDAARLEQGFVLFDALYERLRGSARPEP